MVNDNLGGEKAIIEERRKKLEQLRDKGSAYGNSFKPKNNAKSLSEKYGDLSKEDLVEKNTKGLITSLIENKTSLKISPTGQIILNDVKIPKDNILSKCQGWKSIFSCLNLSNASFPELQIITLNCFAIRYFFIAINSMCSSSIIIILEHCLDSRVMFFSFSFIMRLQFYLFHL